MQAAESAHIKGQPGIHDAGAKSSWASIVAGAPKSKAAAPACAAVEPAAARLKTQPTVSTLDRPPLAQVTSSSSESASGVLSFTDRLTGRRVSLAIVANGKLQTPAQLRAQIKRPLELMNVAMRCFAQRSPRWQHCRQQALPPLASIFVPCCPCWRVLLMFPCVAFACQRLATAPTDMHMSFMSWSWAEMVMERVTRGRVKKVQVLLQRRA